MGSSVYRIEAPESGELCDFCFVESAVTAFKCDDCMFMKDSILPHKSEGGWAACAICAKIIEEERWSDLSDRIFRIFCKRNQVPFLYQPQLRLQFIELHTRFREHMHRNV